MKKEIDSGTWASQAVRGEFRAGKAATMPDVMDYAIDGLLPDTGASVWFGPGSTGKTQLLLWMAAHLAALEDVGPTHWLGQPINRRGHVLVLSAGDLREHIFLRIGGIARAMKDAYPGIDTEALCDRIHVIPFLSLTEEEFTGMNPCLFRGQRESWHRTASMKEIEEFIATWNKNAAETDRIIGVILDSAVSMSGFELSNSAATTNLLFRINRVSKRQNVFWAIVGHTPKGAAVNDEDPTVGAVERLRGSAMWSTAPRTVVELRIADETENLADVHRAYPDIGRRDVVIGMVVKANSKDADFKPRVLRRLKKGAFEDLTDQFPSVCAAWDPTVRGAAATRSGRLEAVADLIRNITDGGSPGATFTRQQLEAEFREQFQNYPALAGMVGDAGRENETSRDHLAYSLKQISKTERVKVQRNGVIVVQDLAQPDAEAA